WSRPLRTIVRRASMHHAATPHGQRHCSDISCICTRSSDLARIGHNSREDARGCSGPSTLARQRLGILQLVKPLVVAAALQQRLMRSLFNYTPLVQHNDTAHMANGRESVGDDD